MKVKIAVAVCLSDLLVIDFRKPVVGGDSAAIAEDQTTDRIGDGGVFLDAPVGDIEIAVDRVFEIQISGFHIAPFFRLFAVENIGFGHFTVAGLAEHCFHAVLDILHSDQLVLDLRLKISSDFQR